ncbi:MAG: DUF4123 domain-containing protein [Ferruginibacter sp.]
MIYILFDTALNGLYTLAMLQKAYPDNRSLFKGTKDENLADVAPYIFRVDEKFFETIEDPYVSLEAMLVFESDEKTDNLLAHFQPFIYKTINGQENYFRFWDARVFERFIPGADFEKRDAFFDGIKTYYSINIKNEKTKTFSIRRGKLQSETVPLNKLFALPVDEPEEMEATSTEGINQNKKIKRKFF